MQTGWARFFKLPNSITSTLAFSLRARRIKDKTPGNSTLVLSQKKCQASFFSFLHPRHNFISETNKPTQHPFMRLIPLSTIYRASDRVRKKINIYAEIVGHIMRKNMLIIRKKCWIMRKFKRSKNW